MFLPDGIEPADPTIQVPNKTYPVSYGAAISLNQFGRPELRIHVDRRIEAVVGFAMTVNSRSATTSPISSFRGTGSRKRSAGTQKGRSQGRPCENVIS